MKDTAERQRSSCLTCGLHRRLTSQAGRRHLLKYQRPAIICRLFLEDDDIRLRLLKPPEQDLESTVYAIDVVGGDFHLDAWSPLSPSPGLASLFAWWRLSAERDRPTSTDSLNFPFASRRT